MATRPSQESNGSLGPVVTPASLFLILLLIWIVTQVQLVLVLGLLALLFGTILEGPVRFLQNRHFPRPAAILMVYIVIIGALVLLIVAVAPGVADQASDFSDKVPGQLKDLREEWRASDNGLLNGPGTGVLDRAIDTIEGDQEVNVSQDALARAIPVLTNITGGIVSTATLLVMTFYYLLEKRLLRGLLLDALTPRHRRRVDRLWTEVENKVGGWMRGQLVLCLIIGTIATISYGIIGLDFWPLLGLWAGLTEIIPIVGPWIGGVPAVLIALTMSWQLALTTTLIIVGMQTLENWFLVPRVMRGAVGLTPLTVFIAILAGTQLMGIVGAVLAIPIAATIQVILTDFLEQRSGHDERMTARAGWRWMLTRGMRDDEYVDDELDIEAHRRGDERYAPDDYDVGEEGVTILGPATREPGPFPDEAELDDEAEPTEPEPDRPASSDGDGDEPDAQHRPRRDAPEEGPDDTSPAFAAWPRPADKTRPRPPSSTWPPLEHGQPERQRRRKRDADTDDE